MSRATFEARRAPRPRPLDVANEAVPEAPLGRADRANGAFLDKARLRVAQARAARGGVSGRMLARLYHVLEAHGLNAEALLGQARDELDRDDVRVSYAEVDRLIELAHERLGTVCLSLALARAHDRQTYGMAGWLLLASPSLRKGLERAIQYQRIWGDGERFRTRSEGGDLEIVFRHPGHNVVAQSVLTECALAEIVLCARMLVQPGARPLCVEFRHAPLGDAAPLRAYFGVEPAYGAETDRVVLAAELVDRSIQPLELMRQALEAQCQSTLDALPAFDTLRERVLGLLGQTLTRAPVLREVARRLRMSPRTLQRGLEREGTSFDALKEWGRRRHAERLERSGASTKEIAYGLGYRGLSGLSRARRRWAPRSSD